MDTHSSVRKTALPEISSNIPVAMLIGGFAALIGGIGFNVLPLAGIGFASMVVSVLIFRTELGPLAGMSQRLGRNVRESIGKRIASISRRLDS